MNLASDLSMLGEFAAARELSEDTLARLVLLLGRDHPLTLGCAMNLVLDLRSDGALTEAGHCRPTRWRATRTRTA
jgi:hypothetical protein